ncbi:MAG: TRAP transporter substrate-binding protein [Candidatus Rokubacteria bacterium]|nr:TRAP transporter substrate-binding protein [Candidatus Rokubacteria bacterium]
MTFTALTRAAVVAAVSAAVVFAVVVFTGPTLAQQPRVLKVQSAVPPSATSQDALKFFADRVDKLTAGQLKIDALPGGAIVPPFEILDAAHKKVLDGAYGISYWWFGKNKAATLFANTPAGIAGMDAIDFLGWLYDGGGLELWTEFYQKELKLNVVPFPSIAPSPQALGWFKRPIKDLADFRGMKCRQTGIVAELYAKMGMAVVNMPGGEILPAAERGTIDCAEWVGGVEDLRLGLHTVWKYHYTPGMHESASVAEIVFNKDVWESLTPQQREAIKSANSETFLRWWATWQRMNADAIAEFVEKHKVQLLTTPPEINKAFLKVWDEFAAAESAKNPFFKKVLESQRAYAKKVVPAKRFMFPPYAFQADHYWPAKK